MIPTQKLAQTTVRTKESIPIDFSANPQSWSGWSRLVRRRLPVVGRATSVAMVPLAGLVLAGCMVGPDYKKPTAEVPDSWHQAVTNTFASATPQLVTWWTNFNDPTLDSLIERARLGNLSLKVAASRISEARALRGVSKSAQFPSVDGTGAAQLQRYSERTTPVQPSGSPETEYYSIGAAATWELDLWGRVRRSVESATAGYEATIEDYRDTLVILYAEVANTYIDVRTLQQRIRYASTNALAQAETLKLTQNLNKAGLVGDLDVSQAQLNLSRTRSVIPTYHAQLAGSIHRLSVLLGLEPAALSQELSSFQPIPVPPTVVNVGLPAELLRQRADVRRAERLLAAQSARIGVATAELYPQFSLPGTLSLEAFDVGNLDGSSLAYSFGPTLRWTLFAGGRVRNTIKAEEARTEQALLAYENTVLRALEDAETAMVFFAQEQERQVSVTRARDSARTSVNLVLELYKSGLTQFQNVLDMERSLAAEEDNLALSRGLLAANAVFVYRALGGGWSSTDIEEPTRTASASSTR